MALFFPSLEKIKDLKVKPEEGEIYLLNFFKNNLDDNYEIYFQPFLNGDRPDIIIMKKNAGVIIIEVKDWHFKNYFLDEKRKWRFKGNGAVIKSPINQVLQYKENIFNLHIDGLLERKIKNFKYWNTVSCVLYFHKENELSINELIVKPYEQDKKYQTFLKWNIDLLGHDNINQLDFGKLLEKHYFKSNYPSKFFTDDLYESFKRFFKPPRHYSDEGKPINFNQIQKRLIVSEPRDQRIKGVVGSGKTTVLAARAVNAHKRINGKVLILTYNITLKNYIHDKISNVREEFDWENFYISNYHTFITTEFNNLGIEIIIPEGFQNWTSEEKSKYFEENYYSNEDIFEEYKNKIKKFDCILIDEIQDYKLEWMRIIKKYFLNTNQEYVLFGDEKQNIYDNELENRDIKTNVSQRPSEIKISNRFNDKIGTIALDFQKRLMIDKYNIDDLTTQQNLSFGNTSYFFINNSSGIDMILNTIQEISLKLKEHPNDITVLGFSLSLLRKLECLYRYKIGEKTKTMFETQETWYKLFLDVSNPAEVVKDGLKLFDKSRIKEDDEIKYQLAILLCVKNLSLEFNYPQIRNKFLDILKKFKIDENDFEIWYDSQSLKKLLDNPKSGMLFEKLKNVRDNKKLHFWINSGTIKFSTIHSFKGWETQTLFLIIEPEYGSLKLSFKELIYTGLTRSKLNLIVLNLGNTKFHEDLESIFLKSNPN